MTAPLRMAYPGVICAWCAYWEMRTSGERQVLSIRCPKCSGAHKVARPMTHCALEVYADEWPDNAPKEKP